MFAAMQTAPLGDDVLGDEPTVSRLEALAADLMGKEAALFVPSGTMGNQIALASQTQPGDSVLFDEDAHMLYYEVGAPAIFSGVVSWTLRADRGVMDPDDVERHILKRSLHTPGTTLLCLENTHNRAGGTVIPLEVMRAYRAAADRHGLQVHLDGARIFNAAVASGVPVAAFAETVDSVNFCLSKGLGAPVGSLLCGTKAMIESARIWRKRLGGGMRQSGILAACGLVALETGIDRLAEDHARARRLGEALSEGITGIRVDLATVQTNIVVVETDAPSGQWVHAVKEKGVWCLPFGDHRLRLVLHRDVDDAGVDCAITAFRDVKV